MWYCSTLHNTCIYLQSIIIWYSSFLLYIKYIVKTNGAVEGTSIYSRYVYLIYNLINHNKDPHIWGPMSLENVIFIIYAEESAG